MDISNWPDYRIMMLPDWCFGRRWCVGSYAGNTQGKVYYYCTEESLPDRFVVWGILLAFREPLGDRAIRATVRLARDTAEVTADAWGCERVCKGISSHKILYEFFTEQNGTAWVKNLRLIVHSKGRKIAFVTNGDQVNPYTGTVSVLISGIPRQVPDWVVSGLAGVG